MSHPLLDGTYAKLDRAEKHLNDLKTEIAQYTIAEPKGISTQFESQIPEVRNKPGISVRVNLQTQPGPTMPLIVGDMIQNTRSALDHLAFALVLRNRAHPTPNTQFPIFDDRLGPQGGVRQVDIQPRASRLANALIEKLQPYYRTDDPSLHPLAMLQELSNIDKHRRLHIVGGYAGNIRVTIRTPVYTMRLVEVSGGLAENGALIHAIPAPNASQLSNMNVKMEHSVVVGLREFRKDGASPLDALLDDLLRFTRAKIIDRFCRRVFRSKIPHRFSFT